MTRPMMAPGQGFAKDPRRFYDVAIARAGPAGATAAYFLAKGDQDVALLEKASFPRDERCGDAWCEPAIERLEEMGVLQELEAEA